jgi:hypothetical protein
MILFNSTSIVAGGYDARSQLNWQLDPVVCRFGYRGHFTRYAKRHEIWHNPRVHNETWFLAALKIRPLSSG